MRSPSCPGGTDLEAYPGIRPRILERGAEGRHIPRPGKTRRAPARLDMLRWPHNGDIMVDLSLSRYPSPLLGGASLSGRPLPITFESLDPSRAPKPFGNPACFPVYPGTPKNNRGTRIPPGTL